MSHSETADDTKTIAPHAESGFGPVDVLKEAEDGDKIYLEMDFYDAPFESVRGDVVNTIEQDADDGRMVNKTIQVEGTGNIEMVNLGVKYDTRSAHVSLREHVRFVKRSEPDYIHNKIDDLAMCELERDVSEGGCEWPGCGSDEDVRLCETTEEQLRLCAECRSEVHNISVVTDERADQSTPDSGQQPAEPATMAELETEDPEGETPAEDVACADCGSYRELVGPISFDGLKVEHGDMVCRSCARDRGVKPSADDAGGDQP